ncbi:MAG: radical SAM protein [Sulfolobales archaeon]|jgi:DNA repair photolyase
MQVESRDVDEVKMRDLVVREIRVKKALSRSGLPEYDYSLNPYIGCQHGCLYCYAQDMTRGEAGERWGEVVYVKINLIDVLRREVRILKRGVVGMSTITDPYIPIEAFYKLSRRSIEILASNSFRISIQTKSPLILRDLDLLTTYRDRIDVGFTITTLDPDLKRLIEPKTTHPMAIERALRKISSSGISTWIFIGPIIPRINDKLEDIRRIIELARETKSEVIIDLFRERERGLKALEKNLGSEEIRRIMNTKTHIWWRDLSEAIMRICREQNVRCSTAEDMWKTLSEERRWKNLKLDLFK